MFGSLIYILLDVGFNIISWGGVKTFIGLSNVFYYFYDDKKEIENDSMINTSINDKEFDKIMISKDDLKIIQDQICNQTKMIIELQKKIENNSDFKTRFQNELEKHV